MGSAVTADGGALQYVKARIKRANGIFVELQTLCENKNTLMKTKIRIFNIHINSVLLYERGAWKVNTQITNKLQMFVSRCLRRIMGIRWPKIKSNTKLWKATGQKPLIVRIRTRKLRLVSHNMRKRD